jgi:SAM-dependent methyltransferase
MSEDKKYLNIISHYESCLEKHGDNHLGVDWPKIEDVDKRYEVMMGLLFKQTHQNTVSMLDFGCGASHLYEYILKNGHTNVIYSGLDLSSKFISLSQKKFPHNKYYCLDILENPNAIPQFDYIIMNGIFTEKRELSYEEMLVYFKKLLTLVFSKANIGVAFNVMSKAVDWERWDLFHLSTDVLINFITKNLSRNFIIRNDYGLYEYTVYLYK